MDARMARASGPAPTIPGRASILFAALLTLALGAVLGAATVAQADEPDMDAVNEQALQTLAITGHSVTQMSLGLYHSAAIDSDGGLWTWGDNEDGQLGDGTTGDRSTPQRVQGLPPVTAVSLGSTHSAAIDTDGGLWTWGYNGEGQLGYASSERDSYGHSYSTTPQKVPNLPPVIAVSLGDGYSAAIDSNGDLWTWGCNDSSQLGYETDEISNPAPQRVPGLPSVAAVSLGSDHSAAIDTDGGLWTWGDNYDNQLGYGAWNQDYPTPEKVPGLPPVSAVSLGWRHSAAIDTDGGLWTWGRGSDGQLGDDTTVDRCEPQRVPGLSNVVAVSLGWLHSAAIDSSGGLWTWGDNDYGQLGDGTTTERHVPQGVQGLPSVTAVSLGKYHSAVVDSDGGLWTWGYNDGRIGDGTTTNRSTPMQVFEGSGSGSPGPGGPSGPEPSGPLPSSIVLSPTTVSLNGVGAKLTVTVTGVGDGGLVAVSDDPSVASVEPSKLEPSGGEIVVTAVGEGDTTITIVRSDTERYEFAEATLPVHVGMPSGFQFGVDNFRFFNNEASFFNDDEEKRYNLRGDYWDYLMLGISDAEQVSIGDEVSKEFDGSCFGMASVAGLVKVGALDTGFFGSETTNGFAFPKADDGDTTENLINYYQFLQYKGEINKARADYDHFDFSKNAKKLVETLKNSDTPLIAGFQLKDKDKGGKLGHAVLAYNLLEASDVYHVYTYDPSFRYGGAGDVGTPMVIDISKDYKTVTLPSDHDWANRESYSEPEITWVLPADGLLSTYYNLEDGLRSMGHAVATAGVEALSASAQEDLTLSLNYDDFKIEGPGGSTAVVSDGEKTSGNLAISGASYLNETPDVLDVQFTLPALSPGQSYTITPTGAQGDPDAYRTSVLDGDGSGFYSAIEAGARGAFTIEADGTASSRLSAPATTSIAVTTDGAPTSWSTVTAEGDVAQFSVRPSGDGTVLIGADGSPNLEVTASNLYNEASVSAAGSNLEVSEPTEGTLQVTGGAGGAKTATLGHSVVFYTGGGSTVDTQANIAPGATAARPADPTREGYTFAGWYADTALTEPYDFASPVTADITLYAKWGGGASGAQGVDMFRMYNHWTGEHLYTASTVERDQMVSGGWTYEGVMWQAPQSSDTPIWRLYNPYNSDHHYARTQQEYDSLQQAGWQGEGVAFYSAGTDGVPIYRLFNPYQTGVGTHHYTDSAGERDANVAQGWRYEDVGWYGLA